MLSFTQHQTLFVDTSLLLLLLLLLSTAKKDWRNTFKKLKFLALLNDLAIGMHVNCFPTKIDNWEHFQGFLQTPEAKKDVVSKD